MVIAPLVAKHSVDGQQEKICDKIGKITPAHFFNMTDYITGDWFMNAFSMISDPEDGIRPAPNRCYKVRFNETSIPGYYTVKNRWIRENSTTISEENNTITIENPDFQSIWKMYTSSGSLTNSVVLHTDYISWSVVYTCSIWNILGSEVKLEFATVYTRDQFIDSTLQNFTRTLLKGYGFHPEKHQAMDQSGCSV